MSWSSKVGAAALAAAVVMGGMEARAASAPAATGRITYQMKGMMNGTVVLSWIEKGKKFRQDLSGTAGNGQKMNTWGIGDGQSLYMLPPMGGKTVLRMKMPAGKNVFTAPGSPLNIDTSGGKPAGKGTVAGKPCQIFEMAQAKVWVWSGIPLKVEGTGQGGMSMTATKLEIPARVDPTKFKLPAGYTVQDFDPNMMRGGGRMPPGGRPGMGGPPR